MSVMVQFPGSMVRKVQTNAKAQRFGKQRQVVTTWTSRRCRHEFQQPKKLEKRVEVPDSQTNAEVAQQEGESRSEGSEN